MINLKRKVQYIEVADKIRGWINSGKCKPGAAIMSCRKLARTYNVSIKTVRNAIKLLVDENLLHPIQGGGTYVRDVSIVERRLNIGCAISALWERPATTEYTQRLRYSTLTAADYLTANNCNIRHIPGIVIHRNAELQEYIGDLDGLLISALDVDINQCKEPPRLSIPTVIFMGEFESSLPMSQVIPEHLSAMRKAFAQLRVHDFTRIVVVYNNCPNHLARRDAFTACALETDMTRTEITDLESPLGEAYNSGLKIAAMSPGTLVCCTSATLAIPIYNALGDRHMKIGVDFDMICYDSLDSMQTRHGSSSQITTIDYSHSRASLLAAEMLVKEIREKTDFRQIIKLPTELTIGSAAKQRIKESIDKTRKAVS